MPVQECQLNGKAGFRWGATGRCYTHDGTDAGKAAAKKLAVKQAIAIGGGQMPRENELTDIERKLFHEARRELDAELPTVDLDGIPILSAGGPVHGVGSPPEGDYWTNEQLAGIVDANRELANEIRPPGKIGHSDEQRLAGVTDGELPAVGWLDGATFRLSDDGTKILADAKRVPAKTASLIKAGAYRTRSVELRKVKSQATGKTYDWVVTGLAWLGGKMPAVRTLDDVVALYEGDEETERRFTVYENAPDINLDELRVMLADFTVDAARAYAQALSRLENATADTGPAMKYSDEQRRKFAEATGLETEKVTDEMLAAAGLVDETAKGDEPEKDKALSEAREANERAKKLEEDLRLERRNALVESTLKDGKLEPGQREFLEVMYDANPVKAREYVDSLKPNDALAKEYGTDDHGGDGKTEEERVELEDKDFEHEFTRIYGHKPDGMTV